MIKRSLIFSILMAFLLANLRFEINDIAQGAVSEYFKFKKQRFRMGEDGHCTSPFTLAVADGIGSTDFISYYLAQILSISITEAMLNNRDDSSSTSTSDSPNFLQDTVKALVEEIHSYEKKYIKN